MRHDSRVCQPYLERDQLTSSIKETHFLCIPPVFPFIAQLRNLVVHPVGLCSPRPQYSTNFSRFNYSLSWLIVQRNKARNGLLVDERTGVYRSIAARCGAVGGGGLLLKPVKVVVLS
jgi:hypothetical protein